MLYDDFENKAKKISKDFIPTEQTRMIAQKAADELADATIQLKNYDEKRFHHFLLLASVTMPSIILF